MLYVRKKYEVGPFFEHQDVVLWSGCSRYSPWLSVLSHLPKGRAAGWTLCWASFSCSPFRTATASAVTTWTILADTSSVIHRTKEKKVMRRPKQAARRKSKETIGLIRILFSVFPHKTSSIEFIKLYIKHKYIFCNQKNKKNKKRK